VSARAACQPEPQVTRQGRGEGELREVPATGQVTRASAATWSGA
jgi:hypothetical protein